MSQLSEQEVDKLHFELMILERWKIIRRELEFISHHHDVVEAALVSQIEKTNANMWKEVDNADHPDLAQDVIESFGGECFDREHTYPNMHRSAMLLTLYSFVEATLAFYCGLLRKYLNISTAAPSKGSIGPYKDWLEKSAGVEFSSANLYWTEIDHFRELRNSIVHAYGDIGTKVGLETYIEQSPHISFSEIGLGYCHTMGNGFELGASFVGHATGIIAVFFEKLTDGMRHLFPLSENDIVAVLTHHHEAEEQKRHAEIKALGPNPSIADVMRHVL
jgi:hypothetical protein